MYFDGSLMLKGSGAEVILISPTGENIKYAIQLNFSATNNVAEYEGLLARLPAARSHGESSRERVSMLEYQDVILSGGSTETRKALLRFLDPTYS